MYKKCSTCKDEKLICEFGKNKSTKDGYHNQCKMCRKDYTSKNIENILKKSKEYYHLNREKCLNKSNSYNKLNKVNTVKRTKKYRENNKNKLNLLRREYTITNRSKLYALNAKRRASKLKATPKWLTIEELRQIEELYEISQAFKLYTGQDYHVDHIIPLQGENVCGLHVPWNLQVLEASENLSKSNKLLEQ
jgi:hypothetical protein